MFLPNVFKSPTHLLMLLCQNRMEMKIQLISARMIQDLLFSGKISENSWKLIITESSEIRKSDIADDSQDW